MRSRKASATRLAFGIVALACALATAPGALGAQRPDTAARASATTRRDSLRPPLSPRRAFLYSTVLPGSAQSVFGRHKAAALMLLVEAMSVAMISESAADVREARRMRGDTLISSYVDPSTGALRTEPLKLPRRFDDAFVRTRQSHLEDWIAFLIANHLFSGADAFVAANLWDIPTQLRIRATPGGATMAATLSW